MTLKEKFLTIKSYQEFDERRHEFKGLDMSDKENRDHLNIIFGKSGALEYMRNGLMYEFTKEKS